MLKEEQMIKKILAGIFLTALIGAGMTGCSSVGVRTGDKSQLGKPYAGVPYALEGNGNCILIWMVYGTPLTLPFTLTYAAIDITSTLVVDTLLLPFDLAIEGPTHSRTNGRCNIFTR